MTDEEIAIDERAHAQVLEATRRASTPIWIIHHDLRSRPLGALPERRSAASWRGVDAANTRALMDDDPETEPRMPSEASRLAYGFAMMSQQGLL